MTIEQLKKGKDIENEILEISKEKTYLERRMSDKCKPLELRFPWGPNMEIPAVLGGQILDSIKKHYQERLKQLEEEFEAL